MTLKELIAEAKKIEGWRLDGEEIRCRRGDCPILAVARQLEPEIFWEEGLDNSDFDRAAEILHLRESVAERVVAAADHAPSDDPLSTRLSAEERRIRRLLIEELIPKSRRPKAA